jgi:hypothetical protein
VLDGVHAADDRFTRSVQAAGVRGDPRSARVGGLDDASHFVRRPRRDVDVRPVHVQLHEVGSVIELTDRRVKEFVGVLGLDRGTHRAGALLEQP